MTNELTTTQKNEQSLAIRKMLDSAATQIKRALPRHMTAERMIRIAQSAIQRQPRLLECDPVSLVKSVIESSELGLEPSGILGHSYLVPFWNSRTRRYEAQLQIGYRGFIELAGRSGRVRSIMAEVVHDCDEFAFEHGLEPKLRHIPSLDRPESAKPIAVYAVAHFKDGGVAYRVLSIADIEKARASSSGEQARESGRVKETPWVTHWDEMARKTAVRALAKYLPLSPELTRAEVVDEYKNEGIDVDFTVVEPAREEPKQIEAPPDTQKVITSFAPFGVAQRDLERALAPSDEPPISASEWTAAHVDTLRKYRETIATAPVAERRARIQEIFKLDPGAQG